MTDDERIAFLSENPINSRWDRNADGCKRWAVTSFFAVGRGASFETALDDCIEVCREKAVRYEAACAGPGEQKGARP